MKRRDLITLLGGSVLAWPLAARAQQPGDRVRRIGVLMAHPEGDPEFQAYIAAFREGLQKLGWFVALRNAPTADLWRDLRSHWSQVVTDRVRRLRRFIYDPAAHDAGNRQRTIRSVFADSGSLDDRVGLHVDQRRGEGGVVSHQYSRHWGWSPVCSYSVDL